MARKKVSSKAVTRLIDKTHRQLAQLKDLEKLGAKITQLTSMADRAVEEYNDVTALLKIQMEGGQSHSAKMATDTSGEAATETGTEDDPATIPDPPDPTEPKPRKTRKPRKTTKAKARATRKTFPVIRRKKPTNGRRKRPSNGRRKSAK